MRRNIVPVLKSVLILALAALAVFQASQLWLVTITNRNFFLYMEARFPPAAPDGQSAWIHPMRIVYGPGCGHFNTIYSQTGYSPEWGYGRLALESMLASGDFVGAYEAGSVDFGAVPVLVFEYSFRIQAETFARALGRRNAGALSGTGIRSFNRVAVFPPGDYDASVFVVFSDNVNEWHFRLPLGSRRHPAENYEFFIGDVDADELHFVWEDGGFSPRAPFGFAYYTVYALNPFQNAFGLLHLSTIRPRIEHFFDNPATIISSPSIDVYTFSNINIMVRYLQFDVLEYRSYRPIGGTVPANLMSDFSAALAFLRQDPYVVNEIFLMGYESRGREHVFRFNYVIGNFPFFMERNWPTEPGCRDPLRAPLEVTVAHGRVVRYRRIAYSFHVGEPSFMNLDASGPISLGYPVSGEAPISLDVFNRR